ncbi:MAG TPA: hypothetical protein PKC28_12670 [Bdellovibrionales bacterium]|nr:hypothetical protein [Bdellovibrionales bacterium]
MFDRRSFKWVIVAVVALLVLLTIILRLRRPGIEKEVFDEGVGPRSDVIEWIDKHYGHDHRKKVALTRLAEGHQYILTHPDAGIEADRKELAEQAKENEGDNADCWRWFESLNLPKDDAEALGSLSQAGIGFRTREPIS